MATLVRPTVLGSKQRMVRNRSTPTSRNLADALLSYLADWLKIPALGYRNPPKAIGDGWENYIYQFQLEPVELLPSEFSAPLILRRFPGPARATQARFEVAVQRSLHRQNFPVPAPLWWEQTSDTLGGPFIIMERVVGPTYLHALMRQPWRVLEITGKMAEVQTRLHHLPHADFPCQPGRLLERSFIELGSQIAEHGWCGLDKGLEWLLAHEVLSPSGRSARLLHLDFHPLNLIDRPGELPAVLDWGTADVGDPHADIATTLMLLRCAPIEGQSCWQRGLILLGRHILEKCYLVACRRRMALCETKLVYYQAWAVLRWLVSHLCFLDSDPKVLGVKPSIRTHLQPDHMHRLISEFRLLTGVELQLPKNKKATGRQSPACGLHSPQADTGQDRRLLTVG